MIKVGIFGGAFNPFHNGHLNLCLQCQSALGLNKVILVPTYISPHKDVKTNVSFEHRYNMVKLAVDRFSNFSVSDIEYKRGGTSYTYDTIVSLKEIMPDAVFYLIIGSDMFHIFHKWYKYDALLELVTLVVGARNENEYEQLLEIRDLNYNSDANIEIVKIDVVELSSTEIRNSLLNGIDILEKLDSTVVEYIKANNLYTDKEY